MSEKTAEAIVLIQNGDAATAFERKSVPIKGLLDNEVLIESEAFGLNFADVMARRGLYREAPPLPCVVGYEVVGRISEVGKAVDPHYIGKRVLAFCRFGAYAKKVVTPLHAIVEIGDLPAEESLALCTQGVTAYYMAHYLSPIHANDRVLIHAAAGGVGSILVQLAKIKGAIVYAKVSDEKKAQLTKKLGADHAINYKTGDYVMQIKQHLGDKRLDYSFNPVAGSTFKKDWSLLGSGGRMVLFGGSELNGAKKGLWRTLGFVFRMGMVLPIGLMMRSKSILGVNMLKIADNKPEVLSHCFQEVFELYRTGQIKAIVGGVYSIDEVAKAHQDLEDGKSVGKLVVYWDKNKQI